MNEDEISDAEEFVKEIKEISAHKEKDNSSPKKVEAKVTERGEEAPEAPNSEIEKVVPGKVIQYGLYRGGYVPTTSTVKVLPNGCYDIETDSKCIYAKPSLPPSGLLLELPEMRSEEVIKIVDTFWDSEKDYKEGNEFVVGGAAYKAGLMIYGPPGSGKSCTIKLISKKLVDRGGTVFYASVNPFNVSYWLQDFARVEPNRKSIVILEDIDSLIDKWGEAAYLEMLDSAKTINNVLFIATTNYPEKLDPRIYNRPGRFSHVIKIGLPKPETRRAYLKAILKNHRDVDYMVENSSGFTIDHLTSLVNSVYREKKDLVSEIQRLRTLFNVPKSEDRIVGIGGIQE